MTVYLLRHGETAYNAEKRYQGTLDLPLSDKGRAALRRAELAPARVYVSPLLRARETAKILFPSALQLPVQDLREMEFGIFEGRSYAEMEHDRDYRAWVGSNCEGQIPGGEKKTDFCARTCAAFAQLMQQTLNEGEELLVIVAHGGTQMAVMERFALPHKDYWAWQSPVGGGFVLDASLWRREKRLQVCKTVTYARSETAC